MKKNEKNQVFKNGVFPHEVKNIASRLAIWSLMILAVLSLCLVSGCRLFTIGG